MESSLKNVPLASGNAEFSLKNVPLASGNAESSLKNVDSTSHEHDLPLMANTNDVLLYHYILDLDCDLDKKVMSGSITLFLDPMTKTSPSGSRRVFSIHEFHEKQKTARVCSEEVKNAQSANVAGLPVKLERTITDDCDQSHCNILPKSEIVALDKPCKPDVSEPASSCLRSDKPFQLVLDSYDLIIHHVEERIIPQDLEDILEKSKDDDLVDSGSIFSRCRSCASRPLEYYVEKWCVRIWKDRVIEPCHFPRVVTIRYSTKPSGTSLQWAVDQDGR